MSWTKADGAMIELQFSQPLNPVSDADASHFTITVPEYTYVPGGEIVNVSKAVAHVSNKAMLNQLIDLSTGTMTDMTSESGVLTLGVSG